MGADLQGFLGGWGKGADAVSFEIDFLVRNSQDGHQQIMTKNRESQKGHQEQCHFLQGQRGFCEVSREAFKIYDSPKIPFLTTVHIGDSE